VTFEEGQFEDLRHFELTRRVFGPEGVYEYRKERTFVSNAERESVFAELLEGFRADALPYLKRPDFPSRFSRSRYQEIVRNPWKYPVHASDGEGR